MKTSEWIARRNAGERLILPSGLEAMVKPVDAAVLMNPTRYPEDLLGIISKHAFGRTAEEAEASIKAAGLSETIAEQRKFWEIVAENALISPKIVPVGVEPDYSKDELLMSDLESRDLMLLCSLINLPLAEVRPFCLQQNADMELILNGRKDLPESQSDAQPVGSDAPSDAAGLASTPLSVEWSVGNDQRVVDQLPVR